LLLITTDNTDTFLISIYEFCEDDCN